MHIQKPIAGQQLDYSNPLTDGLVGCWWMNEGAGNKVYDISGNGYEGTISGGVWQSNSILLNGSSHITTTLNGTQYTDISVVVWFKMTNLDGTQYLIDNSPSPGSKGYMLRTVGANLSFYAYDLTPAAKGALSNAILSAGVWHCAAGVWDNGTPRIFLDGSEVVYDTQATGTAGISNSSSTMVIGAEWDYDNGYEGNIGSVLFYGRALLPSEIEQLHIDPTQIMAKPEPWLYAAAAQGGVITPTGYMTLNTGYWG